jgi:hypothetical protein
MNYRKYYESEEDKTERQRSLEYEEEVVNKNKQTCNITENLTSVSRLLSMFKIVSMLPERQIEENFVSPVSSYTNNGFLFGNETFYMYKPKCNDHTF